MHFPWGLALLPVACLVARPALAQQSPPPSTPPAPAPAAPTTTAAPAPADTPAPAPAPAPANTPAPAEAPQPEFVPRPRGFDNYVRRAPDAAPSAWLVSGLLGFEFEVRGGPAIPDSISPVLAPNLFAGAGGNNARYTGDILRGIEKPYGYDPFALSFTAGYRFFPFLSAGVFFDYTSYQAMDGTDNGDYTNSGGQGNVIGLQRQVWQLGVYARYYLVDGGFPGLHAPILNRLQPWIELGVGYTQDTASFTNGASGSTLQGGPSTTDDYISYNGLVTNVRVGLDWRIAPVFSLGPSLGYGHVFGLSGCVDAEPQSDTANSAGFLAANTCSRAASATNYATDPAQVSGYNVFSFGIFAKVTFGPDVR